MAEVWFWIVFGVVATGILVLDLAVLHRKPHAVRTREAALWSSVWVSVALLFNLWILFSMGSEKGLEFFTGYLIELSLSVDNIFVFVLIFAYFRVPAAFQHRVLFWGIVGAVVLRALFIFGGIALLEHFHWLVYLLGLLLLWGGIQLFRSDKVGVDPDQNRLLRLFRRRFPMSDTYVGAKFFTEIDGRRVATPLMAVLLVVESTDVVFAVDSIPAILAITRDPFIVFTSNICAILGLRSFYFLFASLIEKLRFLHYGLAVVLCFVGVKMLLSDIWHPPIALSLGFVASVLGFSVILSLAVPSRKDPDRPGTPPPSAAKR
ncbi:MAG: TerC/Alx family metal homeostasis membrane protein [Candidatus Eisenbacteria bacterium]|nr:TerC/Alx family metal homeostasis membrane protein [Candidatus Latescibacterota bacterium]MBD3301990.1 TerC/Alx family metal homeostasis membrane protein [Candidatus Eisenbacteria bacterium]